MRGIWNLPAGVVFLLMIFPASVHAQNLAITADDLRIEQSVEGGYYLYIRQTGDVQSVLLTESTADPAKQLASYALRNPVYHPENGDELRMLNGELLDNSDLFSLIDSTPVSDPQFGRAFRIFIPWVVIYGYEWTRNGRIQVLDGTYLSIRAFAMPYADYRGGFRDNPFTIRITQQIILPPPPVVAVEPPEPNEEPEEAPEPPPLNYIEETVRTFSAIAESTKGKILYSEGEEDILNQIQDILGDESGERLDLVIALDSTESMLNDMPFLRENLADIIDEATSGFSVVRIGFVYYRDYLEEYLYRVSDFEEGTGKVQYVLDRIRPAGGRDIPEAVNEALYAAITEFTWIADNRKIILIGDAPPHPIPRGRVTPEMVSESAEAAGIGVHVIILPH